MKELLQRKRTKVALLSLTAVFLCATGLVTLAILTSRTQKITNTFELGNVTTEIQEDFEKTDVDTVFKKEPVVTNTGENDCYVRARVTVSPQGQLDITGWDTTNWVYNEADGFYYYQKVLKAGADKAAPEQDEAGDSTTALFTTVSVKEDYVSTIEGFEVTVYQEAVQAKMNAADGSSTTDMMTIWAAYEANQIPATFKSPN